MEIPTTCGEGGARNAYSVFPVFLPHLLSMLYYGFWNCHTLPYFTQFLSL